LEFGVMAIDKGSHGSVLADLRENRAILAANLEELDRAIACLEKLYAAPAVRPLREVAPNGKGTPERSEPAIAEDHAKSMVDERSAADMARQSLRGPSISALVRQALREKGPAVNREVLEYVQRHGRPECRAPQISTALSWLRLKGFCTLLPEYEWGLVPSAPAIPPA
jgi:hypothetical protein